MQGHCLCACIVHTMNLLASRWPTCTGRYYRPVYHGLNVPIQHCMLYFTEASLLLLLLLFLLLLC